MTFDGHKNFAASTVATAPSPATSGTSLVVAAGDGTLFPAVPFNATIWPSGSNPTAANSEIVRVTNISTDTFTITRTQESTSARTVVVGDQIAATVTAKTLTDIETSTPWLVQTVPFVGYSVVAGTWTLVTSTDTLFNGYISNFTAVAQNDEITIPVFLGAGTWKLQTLSITNSNCGIATFSLDGSSIGTIDYYTASLTPNAVSSVTGIAVAATGAKTLSVKMATKNGSSSSYRINLSFISFLRTA